MQVTMGLRRPAQIWKNEVAILDGPVRQTWDETESRVARLAGALMTHCRTLIAAYKCPRTVTVQPESLPKSGAGKILKRELRSQYWKGLERQIH